MAITNFIPTVWSENLLTALDKKYIGVANCSRDFEGDIKNKGSVVKICGVGKINAAIRYGDLLLKMSVLGRAFHRIFKDEERVGFLLPTSLPGLVAFFGLHAKGHVPAMLNFTAGAATRFAGVYCGLICLGITFILANFPLISKIPHSVLAALVLLFSWLLVAEIPMFSLKFKNLSWKSNRIAYTFLLVSLVLLVVLGLGGLSAVIGWYIILSVLTQKRA